MQYLKIKNTTTLSSLSDSVGQRNVDSILATNNLTRVPTIGKQFAEKCSQVVSESPDVSWQKKSTILNTLTGDSEVFETAALLSENEWKILSVLGTLPNTLRIPETITLPDSTDIIGGSTEGVSSVVYAKAMKTLSEYPHVIDPTIFNYYSIHQPVSRIATNGSISDTTGISSSKTTWSQSSSSSTPKSSSKSTWWHNSGGSSTSASRASGSSSLSRITSNGSGSSGLSGGRGSSGSGNASGNSQSPNSDVTASYMYNAFNIPIGAIQLYSSLADETVSFPCYPEELSDSRKANYTTMPDTIYQYEPWYTYESSGPREMTYTFHIHRDMWSGDHRDGAANYLIRFCEANCYPNYSGSAVYTSTVKLYINGSCHISGIMTQVDTNWSGPIGLDGWYLECKLTLHITEVAETALNFSTLRSLNIIGGS